jgi:hypothetical protein
MCYALVFVLCLQLTNFVPLPQVTAIIPTHILHCISHRVSVLALNPDICLVQIPLSPDCILLACIKALLHVLPGKLFPPSTFPWQPLNPDGGRVHHGAHMSTVFQALPIILLSLLSQNPD